MSGSNASIGFAEVPPKTERRTYKAMRDVDIADIARRLARVYDVNVEVAGDRRIRFGRHKVTIAVTANPVDVARFWSNLEDSFIDNKPAGCNPLGWLDWL